MTMAGTCAYNVPFLSVFLALLTAIVIPLFSRAPRAAGRLTMLVTVLTGAMSAYLLADTAGTGHSFKIGRAHV